MPQQAKKRKLGRPKLPGREAKGKIMPVRLTGAEYERVAEAARKANQTISKWVRSTLSAAVEG